MLEDCAAHQAELATLLPAFAEAMGQAQNVQQACMEATARATERIKTRFEQRMTLLERVAALGQRAQSIQEPVAHVLASEEGQGPSADLLKSLEDVNARTEEVIADAESLRQAAKDDDWVDIERGADALKQQLQSARNKVLVAHRNLAMRSPS